MIETILLIWFLIGFIPALVGLYFQDKKIDRYDFFTAVWCGAFGPIGLWIMYVFSR